MNDWPTTRRHPRTLLEAFQQDGAEAITHYRRPRLDILDVLTAVAIGAALALVIFYWI